MKKIFTIALFSTWLFALPSYAQELDFDTVIKTEEEVQSFEEHLVYLAWLNSPTAEQMEYRKNIADIQIKEAKLGIWESFTPFINYNFGNSEGLSNQTTTTEPGGGGDINTSTGAGVGLGKSWAIGTGVSFRLFPLFSTKHKVSMAKENAKIVRSEVNNSKLNLRAQVLGRYYNYTYGQKAIEERIKTEADTKESYQLALELFKKELAEFEDINNASTAYHKATEERLRAELETKNAKVLLEELIGVSLEAAQLEYGGE